jgi:S1-C subfamily serine protease
MVLNTTGDRPGAGSGALVDRPRKLVVTNYHVVGEEAEVMVLFPAFDTDGTVIAERSAYRDKEAELRRSGRLTDARVVARDSRCDLALLELDRLPEDARAVPLAAASPRPGQQVHSIGNPGVSDALWLYSRGTVRQVYRKTFVPDGGFEVRARVVETQSPINPGDSGGPVVNDRGELVAVVQSAYVGRPGKEVRLLSVFIDVSELKDLLRRYSEEKGQPGLAAAPNR